MRRTNTPVRTYLTDEQRRRLKAKAAKEDTSIAKLVTAAVLEQYKEDLREADAAGDEK